MNKLSKLEPKKVFEYFEKICSIPHGSGNMKEISNFLAHFAKENSLKYILDAKNNVIIYKNATSGYENKEPIILQGHIDMVCQKDDTYNIDFEKDGLDIYIDNDFIKAKGTTLGADNGIAVAMILAILDDKTLKHPPIEAIFTTDEEIGMIGAGGLPFEALQGKKMINLDNEEIDTIVVSCAGGSDFLMHIPTCYKTTTGTKIIFNIKGLKGGHSGIEINNCRTNANMLAGRILNRIKNICDFDIIKVNGGTKANAIPNSFFAEIVTQNPELFCSSAKEYIKTVKYEISDREKNFVTEILSGENGEFKAIDKASKEKLIFTLLCAPNGVMEMSSTIDNLVETSLNLGILNTDDEKITLHFALRSNKKSALYALEERLVAFASQLNIEFDAFGHYPPWEYKNNSELQEIYKKAYIEKFNKEPKVIAIHAGLECGVFSDNIQDIDCISIGPDIFDVHTTKERLDINSTKQLFDLLLMLIERI